ncbi:MAG TPA: hypothetical protein VEB42_13455, partial [Chitinophagaceae bacterium]|nr:hypothetical protein [Chitinophagaceae bacterium]
MSISNTELIWALVIAFALGGSLAYIFWRERQKSKRPRTAQQATGNTPAGISPIQLQLSAYERLILLTERIALPSLVSRLRHEGFSAREMQAMLTEAIRQEFDHNITQ